MVPSTPTSTLDKNKWPSVSEIGTIQDSVNQEAQAKTTEGLFLENQKYHALTVNQRITLTHKYYDIPEFSEPAKKEKDKNIIVDEEKEKVIQAFPISPVIDSAFSNYVANFEKASFKTLTASKQSEQANIPASNKYEIKSGFLVAPHIEPWEFKTHNRAIPQVVQFDGNIAEIKGNSSDPLPSNLKLTEAEWSNIQKCASYSLRATSHCDWFQKASTQALDEALSLLNPEIEQEQKCLDILKDVKQMQIGLEYAIEKLAKMSVYQHAGITSVLRKDFLTNSGQAIPQEQKCQLFSAQYGTSFVFQNSVHLVSPKIREFKSETAVTKSLDTALKLVDSVTKSGGGNPRHQSQPSYSPKKSRGGGNKSQSKTKYSNQYYPHHHNTRHNPYMNAYNKFFNNRNNQPFQQQGSGRGASGHSRQGPKNKGGPFKGQRGGRKGN